MPLQRHALGLRHALYFFSWRGLLMQWCHDHQAKDLETELLGWYYDLFDTKLRNRRIAGDFGNIACDFGKDHNELLMCIFPGSMPPDSWWGTWRSSTRYCTYSGTAANNAASCTCWYCLLHTCNELFKSQVISIFKSQVISILARVKMWFRC